ncbi:MAG: hypothetical protein CML05_17810 [Pseudozobellia sp.]|nr:hypothetical protein [Pseudozobellia sp.]
MLAVLGILVGIIVLIGILFMNLSPEFGGKPTEAQLAKYAKSANYKEGKFFNLGNVKTDMSAGDMAKAIGGMFKKIPNALPAKPLPVKAIDSNAIVNYKGETRFIWFGHSAFLLQMNGKNILLDPMFGDVPSPHPLLGTKRFSDGLPIAIEKLPKIDAVILSHDHYDHLDYGSIKKLKDKVGYFYTPLGVGNHLKKWGVPEDNITELDWWQEVKTPDFIFTSTPAQHFSGRGFSDRDKTLWSSWVIQAKGEKIFFSGDSGYGPHFKTIGEKFGGFDFAMIECGQYNELWSEIHMFPEQTAQVGLDINAKTIMPIHWGAFKLAQHSWVDPVERAVKKAKELNVSIITPQIGVPTVIDQNQPILNTWWQTANR